MTEEHESRVWTWPYSLGSGVAGAYLALLETGRITSQDLWHRNHTIDPQGSRMKRLLWPHLLAAEIRWEQEQWVWIGSAETRSRALVVFKAFLRARIQARRSTDIRYMEAIRRSAMQGSYQAETMKAEPTEEEPEPEALPTPEPAQGHGQEHIPATPTAPSRRPGGDIELGGST